MRNVQVQAPGHGKEEVDRLIGTNKTYAYMMFAHPGKYSEEEQDDIKVFKHRMNSNGVKIGLGLQYSKELQMQV